MSTWYVSYEENDLMHYGVKGRSGRKKGSGRGKIRYINGKRVRYKKSNFWTELASKPTKKTNTEKVLSIIRLKNVSDRLKANYLKKMMAGMSKREQNNLYKELSKHGVNNKELLKIRQLIAGNYNKKATLTSNRPRINSAYDARNYRKSTAAKSSYYNTKLASNRRNLASSPTNKVNSGSRSNSKLHDAIYKKTK